MSVEYIDAWRKDDPRLEADARRIWSEPGVLPEGKGTETRMKELALVAYEDGQLAGLTTLDVRVFPYVRQKFAFIRGFILPAFRMKAAGRDIMLETHKMIETWALKNPGEKLAGLAAIIQVPGVGDHPVGRSTGMVLVGYTDRNEQVRIAWFDHFRVPLNLPTLAPENLTGEK
ncbi:MAG: hypothetical protein Q7T44_01340 [Parvibaculum sp.]|nr:hypothetical protein [Parvibaculum sp.]